jgi:antitoxin component of MazEF toxin-antitoxin module
MHIRTKVAKSGNSLSIRLPKHALALSGLKSGEALDLEIRPGRLILRPTSQSKQSNLDQAYGDAKQVWDLALKDAWLQIFGADE